LDKVKKDIDFRVEILAVGSELLSPDFQDTNSLYLTARLNELGYSVCFKTVVGDDQADLSLRLKQACRQSGLVLVIGGLGPTTDDITREAVAAALKRRLTFRPDLLERIEERFRRRNVPMPESNRKQAFLVEGAVALPNRNGTAAGQWIDFGTKTIVLLPGPPYELKTMFEECVRPRLETDRPGYLARRVLKTVGLTESQVETLVSDLYPKKGNPAVTVLASPGQIEIHLTAFSRTGSSFAESRLRRLEEKLARRLKAHLFSVSGETLEEIVGRLLKEKKLSLAVAESCSGGLMGHRLTNVPGSSDYFWAGVVAYSNVAKTAFLGVRTSAIERHGAVSPVVARQMAQGIRKRARADFGLSITGIAGPAGETPGKPVGLVYTALAWAGGATVQRNVFLGNRQMVKFQSTQKALDMIRRHLLQKRGGRRKGITG
jgi:nicotinamide-nucleotide amidase